MIDYKLSLEERVVILELKQEIRELKEQIHFYKVLATPLGTALPDLEFKLV